MGRGRGGAGQNRPGATGAARPSPAVRYLGGAPTRATWASSTLSSCLRPARHTLPPSGRACAAPTLIRADRGLIPACSVGEVGRPRASAVSSSSPVVLPAPSWHEAGAARGRCRLLTAKVRPVGLAACRPRVRGRVVRSHLGVPSPAPPGSGRVPLDSGPPPRAPRVDWGSRRGCSASASPGAPPGRRVRWRRG